MPRGPKGEKRPTILHFIAQATLCNEFVNLAHAVLCIVCIEPKTPAGTMPYLARAGLCKDVQGERVRHD
jgi:hypothetical protein